MTIWGHATVHVEKDSDKKCWVVSTARAPRTHLLTIPWTDVFKTFTDEQYKQYPDYTEALTTCQSHPATALTKREERETRSAVERAQLGAERASLPQDVVSNVLSIDFLKKKRTT